ncbi:site-specific recombinase, partial [human gut metagenome]
KDTSKKIRAVMKVKGNAGEHLTTNAPYGYMKDPDDRKHWIPDREAADVVYEIGLYVMDWVWTVPDSTKAAGTKNSYTLSLL